MKACLRCGRPIDPALDQGYYRKRKRHPECAALVKREAQQFRRRISRLPGYRPPPRPPRPPVPPPERNPRRSPLVDSIIRRVDAGDVARVDASADRAFAALREDFFDSYRG